MGFDYVLLERFQSDPLEKRFSWYRQLSGGNYFLSVRQVFENEKKIEVKALLKHSGCSVKEMQEIGSKAGMDTEMSVDLLDLIKDVESSLSETDEQLDYADCQVVCYMSGARHGPNTVSGNAEIA